MTNTYLMICIIAGICAIIGAVYGGAVIIGRQVGKRLRPMTEMMADLAGSPGKPHLGIHEQPGVLKRVTDLEQLQRAMNDTLREAVDELRRANNQLHRNGGSSVADGVNRTEQGVGRVLEIMERQLQAA